nr:SDR family NAD(P)-dependent oxidoreductase [Acetatifactor sp.]
MGKALVMVAIVTGASSGFGYEVCKQLVEKGYKVYGISRRKHAPTGVT